MPPARWQEPAPVAAGLPGPTFCNGEWAASYARPETGQCLSASRHVEFPALSKECRRAFNPFVSPPHKLAEMLDHLAGLLRSICLDEQAQDRLGSGEAHQRPVILAQVKLRSVSMGDFDDR